jgi:hypothetical protein
LVSYIKETGVYTSVGDEEVGIESCYGLLPNLSKLMHSCEGNNDCIEKI